MKLACPKAGIGGRYRSIEVLAAELPADRHRVELGAIFCGQPKPTEPSVACVSSALARSGIHASSSSTKRFLNNGFSKSNSEGFRAQPKFFTYPAGLATTLHRPTSE